MIHPTSRSCVHFGKTPASPVPVTLSRLNVAQNESGHTPNVPGQITLRELQNKEITAFNNEQQTFLENQLGEFDGRPITGRNLLQLIHELTEEEGKRALFRLSGSILLTTLAGGLPLLSKNVRTSMAHSAQKGVAYMELADLLEKVTSSPSSPLDPIMDGRHPLIDTMVSLNLIRYKANSDPYDIYKDHYTLTPEGHKLLSKQG